MPEPSDDIERSYNQYLCQKWSEKNALKYFVSNVVAAFCLIPMLLFYKYGYRKTTAKKTCDAVVTHKFLVDLLPKNYVGTVMFDDFNKGSLTGKDFRFIYNVWKRYPFSFFFLFKIMARVASYSHLIRFYKPQIIFCSAEYSFTSSILTNFCEINLIKHINIMHGEKIFDLRETFVRFTKIYIWDAFYIKLFRMLRAGDNIFIIKPPCVPNVSLKRIEGKATYYLQLHTTKQLLRIKESLDELHVDYKVRLHPLYSNKIVKKIFTKKNIEEPNEVSIWESVINAGMIISISSFVLHQAYLLGAVIVIDDISDPQLYKEFCERDYIMLSMPHLLLSEVIVNKGS